MDNPALIVSNPPQHQPDFQAAAPLFWLSPLEVRKKSNYNIPEIWFADSDDDAIMATAEYLNEAGFRISSLHGQDIAAIPGQKEVESFSFQDDRIVLKQGSDELDLGPETECVAVHCQPLGQDGRSVSGKDVGRSSHSPFIDLFTVREGELQRLSLFQDTLDFAGLPTHLANVSEDFAMLLDELRKRLHRVRIDKRLVGMKIRDRPTVVPASEPEPDRGRKRYSFATRELSDLLESISPNLKDINQPDLSSRLVFLTTH